ncbi:MAG: DUF2254 domain-containing protein [Pseudomonadota bacterium]
MNFWFFPVLLSGLAVVFGIAISNIDFAIGQSERANTAFSTRMSIESARLVLSTVAGSMVTVATLVFSMTLVALTTVSQQLGPRILVKFMDDRPTQITLGAFIATFLFSLILLMRIGDSARAGIVSGIGVTAAVALTVVALAVMIHFFDHVAKRLQADALISELGEDLSQAVIRHIDRATCDHSFADPQECRILTDRLATKPSISIPLSSSGHLRRLDAATACRLACEHDLLIRLNVHAGEYVLEDMAALDIWVVEGDKVVDKGVCEDIANLIVVGPKRTPEASIEFEITALVEVALRALSPGINDPFTAVACIDRLANALRQLAARPSEQRVVRDGEDQIRLVYAPEPLDRYLRRSIEPIAHAAQDNPIVVERLGCVLDHLIAATEVESSRQHLQLARDRVADLSAAQSDACQ